MDLQSKPPATKPELTSVLSDVLGDLAFMVADDEVPEVPAGTVWLHGEIRYTGSSVGALQLWCTRGFATRLAANLLGLEPDEGEAQVGAEDAVREFMNVLCGQLVTTWFGNGPVFNLSIPDVCECTDAPRVENVARHDRSELFVEGEPVFCVHRSAEA